MRHRSLVLGLSAALLHGTAYILYNQQTMDGNSAPNPVSWGIWASLAALNMMSFKEMAGLVKTLQFVVGTFGAIATFVITIAVGSTAWPASWEWLIVALGIGSAIALFRFRNAPFANLLALAGALIGGIPTMIGVWTDPSKETPLAWILWVFAFVCTFINVLAMDDKERAQQREKLKNFSWVPGFTAGSLLCLHSLVLVLCLR